MKKLAIISILFGAMALTGCSDDDTPKPAAAERPAAWLNWQKSLSSPANPMVSMSITCDAQGIEEGVDSLDLMAAFVGDECRGCARPNYLDEGLTVFCLPVCLTQADNLGSDFQVTYRYYSNKGKRIYTYGPSNFVADANWGSLEAPYHFEWK